MPVGVVAGDILLAFVMTKLAAGNAVGAQTPPAGWTEVPNTNRAPNTHQRAAVYYRVATAGEPTTYTWQSAAAAAWTISIARFSGGNADTPINVSSGNDSGTTAGLTLTALGVTVNRADCLACWFWGSGGASAGFSAAPTGTVRKFNYSDTFTPGRTLAMDDETRGIGATGDRSVTQINSAIWSAHPVVLNAPGALDVTPPAIPAGLAVEVIAP